MRDPAEGLLETKMVHAEAFDHGKQLFVGFALKRPLEVNGNKVENIGVVLDEPRIRELMVGLMQVADERQRVDAMRRIILPGG